MRLNIRKDSLIFLFILIISIKFISAQWDDCTRDEVNCTGGCGSFIDTDNSGYCDHSEPAPLENTIAGQTENLNIDLSELITGQELKTKTVQEVASIYNIDKDIFAQKVSEYLGIDVKTTDSFQTLHDNYGAEPSKIKAIAAVIAENNQETNLPVFSNQDNNARKKPYVLWQLVIPFVIIYFASFVMAKKKIISIIAHKKIWNIILFTSFFITAVSGMLLVIRLNYGLIISIPFNMLFWHVEAGIAMFLIAVFHIAWHYDYFKAILKKSKKNI